MKKTVPADCRTFTLVAYSFGATISFEICLQLQQAGLGYTLVMLDGSHSYVKMFTSRYTETAEVTEEFKQTEAFCSFMERNLYISDHSVVSCYPNIACFWVAPHHPPHFWLVRPQARFHYMWTVIREWTLTIQIVIVITIVNPNFNSIYMYNVNV